MPPAVFKTVCGALLRRPGWVRFPSIPATFRAHDSQDDSHSSRCLRTWSDDDGCLHRHSGAPCICGSTCADIQTLVASSLRTFAAVEELTADRTSVAESQIRASRSRWPSFSMNVGPLTQWPYTILAQMHRDLPEWVHPDHQRSITVREAARLQSFHDGLCVQD